MSHFELIVLSGASLGDKFSFDLPAEGVIIGRSTDCELVLQDQLVSRRHAKIFELNNHMMLADLGSTHGTVHMGFRLEAGVENARRLSPDDEFKLGDSLFRIVFEERDVKKEEVSKDKSSTGKVGLQLQPKKKLLIGLLGGVLVLALVFLLTEEEPSQLPQQMSGQRISLPEKNSIGFLSDGDRSHADKAQIDLPPADGILEFDFISSGSVKVLLDGVKIETLPKSDGGWEQRILLVRDPVGGRERTLVFDEEKNTPDSIAQGKPITPWGIRNLRFSAMPHIEGKTTDDALSNALALAELSGRSSNSLYQLIRGLDRAALLLLRESGFDAQGVDIERDSARPDPELIKLKLEGLIQERKAPLDPGASIRHFKVVYELIGVCEAEIWRKFTIDMRQAVIDSRAKDFIAAHDRLLAVQTMIGDESDYRYRKAGEFLDDKKIVPAKVRKNPGRYRKDKDN
jgi:pSer/pThr/pTyr-binding forkhead associated (FHA) protein